MIWFKRNDHEYVVRDAATIKELEAIMGTVPLSTTRQGVHTALTDERRVARTGATAPDVSAQLQEIQTKLAALSAQVNSSDTTDASRRQMADLGRQLETLGRSMQQPVLYAKASNATWLAVARAFNQDEIFAVLDRAITKGVAQQVK
jgi:cob(I)alamin adenosyltransferase